MAACQSNLNLPAALQPEVCQDKAGGESVCVCVCVFMYVHVLPFGDRGWMRVQKFPVICEFYSAINLVTKVDQSPGSGWGCFYPL